MHSPCTALDPTPPPAHMHPLPPPSCEPDRNLRVAVLVSGGVDSSVALRMLVAAGHRCTAFYLQIWFQEDFRNFWDACPWEDDLAYAKKVREGRLRSSPSLILAWRRPGQGSVEESEPF